MPAIQQVSVKVPFLDPSKVQLDDFIPLFHGWIREKRLPDHLLIDVADYRHVPDGPGVMIIAHEAHYGIDGTGGQLGLCYFRKRDEPSEAQVALKDALKRATIAAKCIQDDCKLAFDTSKLEMRVMSRLHAPNTADTREVLQPAWASVLQGAGYDGLGFSIDDDVRTPFTLRVASVANSPDLDALVAAL